MQNVRAACTMGKLEIRFTFSPVCVIIVYLHKIIVDRAFSLDFRFVLDCQGWRMTEILF